MPFPVTQTQIMLLVPLLQHATSPEAVHQNNRQNVPGRWRSWESSLTTETVQSAALSLQSIDDIERGDGLALGVLSVGDGVTDDTLQEGL